MNNEVDPILVGEVEDIEVGTVEDFEHEDINFAIFRLESGFFCTQGNCNCEEKAPLSESEIDGEELECVSCGETYSIVSGDCVSQPELDGLKIYDISEEDAYMLCSLAGDLKIAEVVDVPNMLVTMHFPKSILNQL